MPQYGFLFPSKGSKSTTKTTPQSRPLPGREMVQNDAGGFVFPLGRWPSLRRALILGTAEWSYYIGRKEMTDRFLALLRECIEEDPDKVASELVYAGEGRTVSHSTVLIALAVLSTSKDPLAKRNFNELFPQLVRTGSHLYEVLGYIRGLRGIGRLIKRSFREWLTRDPGKLAYQLLKYQQRYGWAARDVFRMFRPVPPTKEHQELYRWVVKGWDDLPAEAPCEALKQVWWFEWLKRYGTAEEGATVAAIEKGNLTHEMTTGVGKMDPAAWEALFWRMPAHATLRNLGSLTDIGVISMENGPVIERLKNMFLDREAIRKTRLHPVEFMKALGVYRDGGARGRSKKSWSPVGTVIDILESALELSFETLEPTGKEFLHAVDVSGSMGSFMESCFCTCCEAAAAMCLVTVKAERNYEVRGFSSSTGSINWGRSGDMNGFVPLGISREDTFRSAAGKALMNNFGATDASLPWRWARETRKAPDVVVFWTDNETWAGAEHPSVAKARLEQQLGRPVKGVYVAMTASNISLADPKDEHCIDIAGFDPSVPKVIQMFVAGEI
ncbi:MAG: TROVE domain-containing protein [Candidatus Eiseniibacteriota bacterium]|nr:MAG: TROVE domain-containing protein [Candidatus Eisenbacteria bacterium]